MLRNMENPSLVPEVAVSDYAGSLRFYCDLLGFEVGYERPQEGYAYLMLGSSHLMIDQIGLGRTWRTGDLLHPLGRGVNFQIQVRDITPAMTRLKCAEWPLFLDPETRWYRVASQEEAGVRQLLVQDPDGYLLRLQMPLGRRQATG